MINLTLCPKDLKDDVPKFDFKDSYDAVKAMSEFLDKIDFLNAVLVCFVDYLQDKHTNDHYDTILVSHNHDEIFDFSYKCILDCEEGISSFNIFEFDSYQEAFKYCLDLKESF